MALQQRRPPGQFFVILCSPPLYQQGIYTYIYITWPGCQCAIQRVGLGIKDREMPFFGAC